MNTIHCPLFDAALMSRHETALIAGAHVMTYFDLDDMAARVARNLKRNGVTPGARVALFLENSWQTIAILYGCWRAGAVACPLNTRLPREAVLDQLRQLAAGFLVARLSQPLQGDLATLRILRPDDLLVYRDPEGEEAQGWPLTLTAPAVILFTSGTSGAPKAAELTVSNLYYSARGANVNMRLASRDCWLFALPLYHVGGLGILLRCALAGSTVALPETGESIEQAQERYGVTHLSLVPTQLYRLLNEASLPDSFAKLKAILLGGSAAPTAMLVEAARRHWPVFTTYGLTEMASQVCTMGPASPPAKRMTSGLLLRHRELRIAEDGEIWVRGQTLFNGYVEPDGIRRPQDENGWFPTGDLGARDAEGYLTVLGRKDNMFISGGENIQPEEIEGWLAGMPEIAEALVAPRPDVEFGARPVAFIRWHGEPVADDELLTRLSRILPRYKLPVAFLPWPVDLPEGMKPERARFLKQV
ncbi:MAG TPA: o-succinylbenzoate--CoA ligase [Kiritimatiellia bacterium]|nr:o-succinylbenzoate--CoA ligase [Kiritimatiellia bacterium]